MSKVSKCHDVPGEADALRQGIRPTQWTADLECSLEYQA